MTPEERRRFSRLLSRLADASVADALGLVQEAGAGRCRRVGITGPPGAGKSSLIAKLARHRLRDDGDLAIIAVDPSSPVSGGAILGDRIRMEELATDPHIFIRSLATRSSHDGLADNLPDILAALDGFGFAEVLLETVGVGQVEYAVSNLVDTTLLVLPPGAGDQVQAMKSGILEKADIYVINKADQPGAAQLAADLRTVLKQRTLPQGGWAPPIVSTAAGDAASLATLSAAIDDHQLWARESGRWTDARGSWRANHVASLLSRRIAEVLDDLPPQERTQPVGALYRTVLGRVSALGGPA
ncbi:MAG: GTP-binding protein [Acetobacteraceae bacterium]|nr:GTP-binding protein [Acetobacteraceae bacterium]